LSFFVYPQGLQSHKTTFEARDTSVPNSPFIATGLEIKWRLGGVIVKTGDTSFERDRKINTGDIGDINFEAKDAGLDLDFTIGASVATPATLTNQLPSIESAGIEVDQNGITPKDSPRFFWTYSDPDSDPQLFFRLLVGTTSEGSDLFDSGKIFGDPGDANGDGVVDQNDLTLVHSLFGKTSDDDGYLLAADFNRDGIIDESDIDVVERFLGAEYPGGSSADYSLILPDMPEGTMIFWTLTAGDGEKITPSDPDTPEPARKEIKVTGEGMINAPPVITDVLIGGV
jgi:hypothetical protein